MSMATILSLPDELLEYIVDFSRPDGFEGLTLTCKRFFIICEPYVKRHNELNRLYRRFSYGLLDPSFPITILKAVHLIARIVKEPIVARYIREADFRLEGQIVHRPTRPYDPQIVQQQCEDAVAFIEQSPLLKKAGLNVLEFATTLEGVSNHAYSQHAAVFLLSMLPNLSKLTLPPRWDPQGSAKTLLDTIVRNAAEHHDSSSVEDYGLRKLIELRNPATRQARVGLHRLSPLLCLPTLQTFVGLSLMEHTEVASLTTPALLEQPFAASSSIPSEVPRLMYSGSTAGLRSIELKHCCLSPEGLTSLLKDARLLRSLRYYHSTKAARFGELDLVRYLGVIASNVGHHLEELSFLHDDGITILNAHKIDLREQFPCLRILELPAAVLCKNGISGRETDFKCHQRVFTSAPPHFSSVIPQPIAKLSFIGDVGGDDTGQGLTTFFQDLCKLRRLLVPNLKEMHVCYPVAHESGYQLRCAELQKSCAGSGLAIHLYAFASMRQWTTSS